MDPQATAHKETTASASTTRRRRSRSSSLTQSIGGVFVDCGPSAASPVSTLVHVFRVIALAAMAVALVMATSSGAAPTQHKQHRVTPSPLYQDAPMTIITEAAKRAVATPRAVEASSTKAPPAAQPGTPQAPYDSKGRGCCESHVADYQDRCWNKPGTPCPYMRRDADVLVDEVARI